MTLMLAARSEVGCCEVLSRRDRSRRGDEFGLAIRLSPPSKFSALCNSSCQPGRHDSRVGSRLSSSRRWRPTQLDAAGQTVVAALRAGYRPNYVMVTTALAEAPSPEPDDGASNTFCITPRPIHNNAPTTAPAPATSASREVFLVNRTMSQVKPLRSTKRCNPTYGP